MRVTVSRHDLEYTSSATGDFEMENGFWMYLEEICRRNNTTQAEFIAVAKRVHPYITIASAVRIEILKYFTPIETVMQEMPSKLYH